MVLSIAALSSNHGGVAYAQSADGGNLFNDPFVQATHGLAACPLPEGPRYSAGEARTLAHERSQRGVSCYLAGQCRLMNSYYYDAEIIPRVVIALHADDRFNDTSVWLLGQRRWVFVKGCIAREEQRAPLLERVRNIDDVQRVIDELKVEGDRTAPAESGTSGNRRPKR